MGKIDSDIETILDELREFMPRLIDACNSVAEHFYRPMTDSLWSTFGDVVQGMDDLYRSVRSNIATIEQSEHRSSLSTAFTVFLQNLESHFAVLNRNVDNEDYVAAGDCMRHELLPMIKMFACQLGEERRIVEERISKNMKFFQERFPRVFQVLSRTEQDSKRYQIFYGKTGKPGLYAMEQSPSISLYSIYDPQYEADRWGESIQKNVAGKTNVIFYGLGLGYHLRAFGLKYQGYNVYLYEPDEHILLKAIEVVDFEELLGSCTVIDFVAGNEKSARDGLIYRYMSKAKGETSVVGVPYYDKLDQTAKASFMADAKTAILNYASSVHMYDKYGLQWARNIMYNLPKSLATPSIKGLKGGLNGRTAVIVGAGPSLAQDINWLKQLKEHALIISAGSTIQSLQHFGIDPHLVISMDGTEANNLVFQHVDITHIPFLYIPQIECGVLESRLQNVYHAYFSNDKLTSYFLDVEADDPVFESSHSVTGTAIQTAVYLGCTEIVFTGQDLSYPTEAVYAPGAKHFKEEWNPTWLATADLTVENIQGGVNRTTKGMKLTLGDIEDIISKYPNVRFTNTTAMGAIIQGTQWKSMEKVCQEIKQTARFYDIDFTKFMRDRLPMHSTNRVEKAINRITALPMQLADMESKLRSIHDALGKLPLLSRTKSAKYHKLTSSIERTWKEIAQSPPFKAIFSTVNRGAIIEFERNRPDLVNESNQIRRADMLNEYLGELVISLLRNMPTVMEYAQETVERLNSASGSKETEVSN